MRTCSRFAINSDPVDSVDFYKYSFNLNQFFLDNFSFLGKFLNKFKDYRH